MQGRGNAKSVKLSGIADYFMCSDCFYPPDHPEERVYELSPEVDCVAVDRQQASSFVIEIQVLQRHAALVEMN